MDEYGKIRPVMRGTFAGYAHEYLGFSKEDNSIYMVLYGHGHEHLFAVLHIDVWQELRRRAGLSADLLPEWVDAAVHVTQVNDFIQTCVLQGLQGVQFLKHYNTIVGIIIPVNDAYLLGGTQ